MNEGIVNFLPGAVISSSGFYLSVNNPNTAAGTAVTVNLQQSQTIRALSGTIAVPSSGTNTATINLVGAGTNLTLSLLANASYAGTIAGEGSVSVIPDPFQGIFTTQTFAGNNTYSGTTTVGYRAHPRN